MNINQVATAARRLNISPLVRQGRGHVHSAACPSLCSHGVPVTLVCAYALDFSALLQGEHTSCAAESFVLGLKPSGSAAQQSDKEKHFPYRALALRVLTGDQLATVTLLWLLPAKFNPLCCQLSV